MDKETRMKLEQVQRLIEAHAQAVDIVCHIWHLVSILVRAYRDFDESETPEGEALARWRLHDAREDLEHYLHKQSFTPAEILDVVRLAQLSR